MAERTQSADRLFELLPAIYRERDEQLGGPLRALLRIVQEQSDLIEADIRQLWDDFFIETCEPWVIPYLGDLVGNLPLFDGSRIRQPRTAQGLFPDLTGPRLTPEVALRSRADVAKTIHYRRRKATLPMLEELARDVTGWGAHAAEMFARLGWTQCVRNHLRMESPRTPDLRRIAQVDLLDGPFDTAAHTVDVRPIAQLTGWYDIKNIGFFLWRLRSYENVHVQARSIAAAGNFAYTFSPLGNPAPLFTRWRREGDEAGLATELHVPGPIRPLAFCDDLRRHLDPASPPPFTDFYGLFDAVTDPTANPTGLPPAPGSSFMIFRDGVAVPPAQIRSMNLESWAQPTAAAVGVDAARGRMAFGPGFKPAQGVDVYFHHGFSADLGGGSYARGAWLVRRDRGVNVIEVTASANPADPNEKRKQTLGAALLAWSNAGKPGTVISILDSRTYEEAVTIEPADGRWLVIEAADGVRPHLKLKGPRAALTIKGDHKDAAVTLSGLLVEGAVEVTGQLGRLRLLHTTLVPGRGLKVGDGAPAAQIPSMTVKESGGAGLLNEELKVEIAFSITGPLRIPEHALGLWLLDSIVDGLGTPEAAPVATISDAAGHAGPPAWLERVTLLGPSSVKELSLASEAIFAGAVAAERRQEGCVRFSHLAPGSRTPRRYRCQPDLEVDAGAAEVEKAAAAAGTKPALGYRDAIRAAVEKWLAPSFTAAFYGLPGYAQLHSTSPLQIRTGAEDGSEMGAFCHLKQPQREANLRLRLEEYLPFGLEAGFIYVT
ncbi:MAG TPA: hypothetical protein VHQ90_09550 [Thermoanaerobaculia bacterium]|nr:hypothetical protein [Thermoanaerobaculia bacterium]